MDIAIMIEGQMGINWPIWQQIVQDVERLGFAGLYRSDHFTNQNPPDQDSLDAWVSLTWAASHSQRIEFGTLVSPVSFREPVMLARTALAIDDLSGGRLQFGVGAGWQEREHATYGYDLLETAPRMARFAEAVEVMTRLLRNDAPTSFSGEYYQLRDALLLPRPQRRGGPPVVIGGNGPRYTLPLAARYADEWNAVFVTLPKFAELNGKLDALVTEHGLHPADVRRTMMTGLVPGKDDADVRQQAERRNTTVDALRERGIIVGTQTEVVEQLGALAEAGVQRVMLQWFDWNAPETLAAIADALLPHFPTQRTTNDE